MECEDDDLQELIMTLEIILNGVDSAFLNLPKALYILAKEIKKLREQVSNLRPID